MNKRTEVSVSYKYGGTLYVAASSVKKICCGMCHISVVCLILMYFDLAERK
jgi:hypothetical protein